MLTFDIFRKVKEVVGILDNYLDLHHPSKHEARLFCIPTAATQLGTTLRTLDVFLNDLSRTTAHHEATESILRILEDSLPILKSSLLTQHPGADENGHESPSGRFRDVRKHRQQRRQQRNTEEKTCEEIKRINADLKHHIELLTHISNVSSPTRLPSAELPASTVHPAELPSSRHQQAASHRKIPSSPPPPYASCAGESTDQDDDSLEFVDTSSHSSHQPPRIQSQHKGWKDPITRACQDLMKQRFPTTNAAVLSDYTRYRKNIRQRPEYRWYFNFRYGSLTLQPDLPTQVFLTQLIPSTSDPRSIRVLAYLFEDCLVFANSPSIADLPRPDHANTSGNVPPGLDGGLMVLEQCTIRFAFVQQAAKLDGKMLELRINSTTAEAAPKQVSLLTFQATCHRAKVFEAIRPWLAIESRDNRGQQYTQHKAHSDVEIPQHHNQHRHHHRHHQYYDTIPGVCVHHSHSHRSFDGARACRHGFHNYHR